MTENKVNTDNLPRWQKLLLVLYKLSNASLEKVKYEDIVVGAFKMFPETFHLPGYKQYPDSGDLIHKPLYSMKSQGFLTASQKVFSLTAKGISAAKEIKFKTTAAGGEKIFKPSRSIKNEIQRIMETDAMKFFAENHNEKILDTDFLQYIGVGVYSTKSEFNNRLNSISYAIENASSYYPERITKQLISLHTYMTTAFKNIVDEINQRKERE